MNTQCEGAHAALVENRLSPAPSQSHYRVAVIGGGPAGSSCALALANAGVSDILVVEASSYSGFKVGESIPPESRMLLRSLNIDDAFLTRHHEPCYGSCSYWGSDKRGYNDFLLNPHGHGWHLDRSRFDAFLAAQAHAAGVELLTGSSLSGSEPLGSTGYMLSLKCPGGVLARVHADFVVDASGRRSVFARQRGARQINSNPLICFAASLRRHNADVSFSRLTHLEAVEQGWWYVASIPGNAVIIAFATDVPIVRTMQLQKAERWYRMLRAAPHTSQLMEGIDPRDAQVRCYPVPSYCLDRLCGERWLAIGDAGSAYDPITAQGIVKSLSNGIHAAQAIQSHMSGTSDALEAFAQMVRAQYRRYLDLRRDLYCLEQRWPASEFWQRQITPASM